MDGGSLEIRSFRVVFDLERRIHRVDRFRVPLPYGLPLRSVAYAVAALGAVLLTERVPLLGAILAGLPAPARLVLVPAGVSYALTRVRVDGRSAHAAALCWLRFVLAPRELAACRPLRRVGAERLADLTLAADASSDRWRRAVVHGPAELVVAADVELRRRGKTVRARRAGVGDRGAVASVSLGAGDRLVLR